MKNKLLILASSIIVLAFTSCGGVKQDDNTEEIDTMAVEKSLMQKKVEQFVEVELKADLSKLTDNEKKMIPVLVEVSKIMEELFWKDALYVSKEEFLEGIEDEWAKKFAIINYGPWERLENNKPFIDGYSEKPLGANYYPQDITKEEFESMEDENKTSWYTLIRRDEAGKLKTVWYHEAYPEEIKKAAELLKQAAELADDEGLKNYFNLRAEALLTDEYLDSDLAWMDMKDNTIDFVVGPIENYEDALFGYKSAHSAQILIKDKDWSERLNKYASLLPTLQAALPCDEKYKQEPTKANADLNAYDVIYYGGDCNAGSKNIAINLPNDPRVHAEKGSRKLQLKNAMQAKFDNILIPISNILIAENQRKHVQFNAFFENTMFHEVGHGLGINYTLPSGGKEKVRDALQNYYTKIEEGKADLLGLFMITELHEMGEITNADIMDNYVTFMASIFRSIRFGASSSHGVANLVRFNYFEEVGAFTKDETTGTYSVDFDKMKEAVNSLSSTILAIQGEGDIVAAEKLITEKGVMGEVLKSDLERIAEAGIPLDIRFKQGLDVLGLQ